jgi:hypothetical protein
MAAAKSRCQALECVFTAAPSGALASLPYCLLNVYTNSFAVVALPVGHAEGQAVYESFLLL